MSLSAALLVALAACSGPAAAAVLGEQDAIDLFAEIPVPFAIEDAVIGDEERVFRLRSAQPIDRSSSGALYLRATVTFASPGPEGPAADLARRLASADPDLGLSYAWDYVAADADSVVHVHAACTFSQKSFEKVALAASRKLAAPGAEAPASFWCRCGGGCQTGAPFSATGEGAAQSRTEP